MILVTGATGRAGSEVVRALLEHGHELRAFVRDPDKAQGLFGDRVQLAIGDLADRRAVRAALAGAGQVVLSGPDDPGRVEWESALIDDAAAMGVRRIVKLSSIVAEPGAAVAFWDWHGRIERHLRESGVPAVILRSSFYLSNVLAAAEQAALDGRLYAPAGDARIAMIDPRDVGAAAAAVLSTSGHDGRTYVLTGPEAITYARLADELSAAIGRPIEFVDVPDEAAVEAMIQGGLPAFVAQQIVSIFAMLRQGAGAQVTTTVESLTGAPPRDIAAFVREHASVLTPVVEGARP